MKLKIILIALCTAVTCLYTTCSTNPVTGKKELMLLSKGQEVAMGQEADPGIISYFGLYEDEKLQNFINKKGEAMAKISHRPELDYQFKIVDSPVVNAFAVPGGYIYFTRGIMAHFNNEAEFAGVLGHEIGHVTARHSAKQYSKSMLAQLGLVVGVMVSEDFAQFADLAQTGVALLFLKYGRDHERQSDRLGVEYSGKVGYDAREMADFFNTLDRVQGHVLRVGATHHPPWVEVTDESEPRGDEVALVDHRRVLAAEHRRSVAEDGHQLAARAE